MSRCGIYARVSTSDQSTDAQVAAGKDYCAARGWTVVDVYADTISGALSSRPQLDRLLKAVRSRKVDVVVVKKFDRLGRSLPHLVGLLQEMRENDVSLVSLDDGFDLGTSTGRLQANLLGSFAEFERDLCSERVKAGMAHAKRLGKHVGRPTKGGAIRDRAVQLREQGQTYAQIGVALDVSPSTARRLAGEVDMAGLVMRRGAPGMGQPKRDRLKSLLDQRRKHPTAGLTYKVIAGLAGVAISTVHAYAQRG